MESSLHSIVTTSLPELIYVAVWAALQLVFIMEVSIGNSVMMFLLRGIGTTVGCFWGWAALEVRSGNRVVVAAMVCVGLIPSTYVQLGSKHPKAGQVRTFFLLVFVSRSFLKNLCLDYQGI